MKGDIRANLIIDQSLICSKFNVPFEKIDTSLKVGVSTNIKDSQYPIYGLRHLPEGDTNGWYFWSGEYSEDEDFFKPIHTIHLFEWRPEVMKYLALLPGYIFLLAEGFDDVWFDEKLL